MTGTPASQTGGTGYEGCTAMAEALTHARAVDALHDPERIAAARRLLREVSGHAAFDRLSRLAALLVGTEHAKVTDRKSTRLNSSHANISYAVFCLKKKSKTPIVLFLHHL